MTTTEPTLWDDADADLAPAIAEAPGGGEVAELAERARNYARSSKAANTLRAYESDLRHFGAWCEARGLDAFPAEAETVALYLTYHAGRLATSTLRRRLATIFEAHQAARFENPTIDTAVRVTWAGIRRTHGKAPDAKEAAVTEVVAAMVARLSAIALSTCETGPSCSWASPALSAARSCRPSTSPTSSRRGKG